MTRKKLIEVALPLDAINVASAREKSIRHGHPSTLHLWWARRPLAAARAVIFAQMVDDPSAWPDQFPTEEDQEQERQRLFAIIEDLVLWENTTNEKVLQAARDEIWKSWRRTCAAQEQAAGSKEQEEGGSAPQTKDSRSPLPTSRSLYDPDKLPAFHDPFAGGGAIPLEAQRLGLESYASDLNPVAVLINKAMIEIPPKFAGQPPVSLAAREKRGAGSRKRIPAPRSSLPAPRSPRHSRSLLPASSFHYCGAQGLAEDVRYYGQWMRDEAEKRIGHLYPKVKITPEIVQERPDLETYKGRELTVIAWIWARTVKSPNPAFANVDVPLASTFMLSTKKGKEAYIEPVIEGDSYRFSIKTGQPQDPAAAKRGTKSGGSHSSFLCLMSGTPMSFEYLRQESKSGRMGSRLMAIVAEGDRGRVYLSPTTDHEEIAKRPKPEWRPDVEISHWPGRTNVVEYGMTKFGDLFTPRQLVALTTFSDLVGEARERVRADAIAAGLPDDGRSLDDGGTGAAAYADAVGVYLGMGVSRLSDISNTICSWEVSKTQVRHLYTKQAIPMLWDFGENNVFGNAAGDYGTSLGSLLRVLMRLPATNIGYVAQSTAQDQNITNGKVVSTDPPYYDNIGYADLSDFFYVWLRKTLQPFFPNLFATLAVPKTEELVATPYRHGGKEKAEAFFLDGMTMAIERLATQAHPSFPVTIYYAFKQSEKRGDAGTSSTGWETFLDAVIRAGFALTGTWPMRTELSNRMIGSGTNALASSIILVCRKRATDATTATRREFLTSLKRELPIALKNLQHGNIAPVDLAQAAIGPGMAVYTRFAKVLDADGTPLSVRGALMLINEVLDESLAEQEGDFDADTRWALAWFEHTGFEEGDYGVAETLSTAKNTSVAGLVEAGFLRSKGGKVRLFRPSELPEVWDPHTDERLTVWESVHHLIRVLEKQGEQAAADLAAKLGIHAEIARELAYRLYTLCERKKRAPEALSYNGLVQSWPEIMRLAVEIKPAATQQEMAFGE